jgi:tetratricopeptide (TPR) repeat protein
VVFVSGVNGAGKSHLLRQAAESLADEPGIRVIAGGVADGRYAPARESDDEARLVSAVGTFFSNISDLPIPVVSPATKILAQAVELSIASREVLSQLTSSEEPAELPTLFEPLLAAAAREDPDGLLVCLVDDADWLPGDWWLNLQFSLARAISQEIPLLLVVAVDPSSGEESGEPAYSGDWVAKGLLARGLAEGLRLEALDAAELAAWLGPMSPRLAGKIVDATGGYAGDSVELFEDLKGQGVIAESSGTWRLAKDADVGIAYASNRLARRLTALFEPDPDEAERLRRLLNCAALEGNAFTADVVAAALERDRDEVVDLLDELCEDDEASALLRDLGGFRVEDPVQGWSRHIWRYGFVRTIDWRVARDRFGDEGHGDREAVLAGQLADQLVRHYGPQRRLVAHIVTALLKRAGRDEEASEFAKLAWLRVTAAVLDSLCKLTISADKSGWSPYDYRSAAEVLIAAGQDRLRTWTVSEGLENANRAFEYAELAGQLGRTAAARALVDLAQFEGMAGNVPRARQLLNDAVERSRVGNQSVLGSAHLELAKLSMLSMSPDLPDARKHLAAATAAFREIHSKVGEALCFKELGEVCRLAREYDLALQHNERALQLLSREGRVASVGSALQFRAEIDMDRGRPDLAKELLVRLVALRRDNNERFDEAACLRLLSAAERQLGRLASASQCMGLAAHMEMELGRTGVAAFALLEQGKVEIEAGQPAEAKKCITDAARLYQDLGSKPGLEECRLWMAVAQRKETV